MSLDTPTTAEINATIIAQLEASLNQTIPSLPKSFLRVLAKVMAAVFILLYKYAGFTFEQIFIATASNEDTVVNGETINPLVEWGRLIGVGDPVAATQAELTIDITVTNQTGTLPSGTQLFGDTNGVTYITIGDVVLDAPTKSATIRASSDQAGGDGSGAIGNLDNGAICSFANPLPNVSRGTVVTATTTVGVDAEGTEVYRQRIIDLFQKRPQGGALADYEIWGEAVAGIINVYPYTGDVPGEVDLFSEATTTLDPDGIPTAAQLVEVFDATQVDENGLATRRPVGAGVNSFAISRVGFDVTVTGLTGDDVPTMQTQIQSAVEEFFLNAEPFIDGVSSSPRKDRLTSAGLGGVVQTVIDANNGTQTGTFMALTAGGDSITIYNLGIGEKSKLTGTVSFT